MSDAARASVNVNLNPNLLSQLAAKVGAPRSLTVHRVADLSRQLHDVKSPRELEAKVAQLLGALQAEAGAEIMSCRFRPQPNCLISLRLRENPLGPAGMKAVAQAMLSRAPLTLRVLSLASVGAGDKGVLALTSALGATSAVHLMSLDLSDNGLTGSAGPPLAALIAAKCASWLEELRLTRNPLGDIGVSGLSNGLVANMALRKLSLDQVNLGPVGVTALALALRSNSSLQALNVGSNPKLNGEVGCAALAELLTCAKSLERLWAGDSALGSGAASALAKALEADAQPPPQLSASFGERGSLASPATANSTTSSVGASAVGSPPIHGLQPPPARAPLAPLSYLWLERAQLRAVGAAGVAQLLTSNRVALVDLWLGGNGLADDAAALLAAALPVATSLRRLHLERNEITLVGAGSLLDAALASSFLRALHLEGNALTDRDCTELHDRCLRDGAVPLQGQHPTGHSPHEPHSPSESQHEPLRLMLRDPRLSPNTEPSDPEAAALMRPDDQLRASGDGEWTSSHGWRHPLAANMLPSHQMHRRPAAPSMPVYAHEEVAAADTYAAHAEPPPQDTMQDEQPVVDAPSPEEAATEVVEPPPEASTAAEAEAEAPADSYEEAEAAAEAAVAELEEAAAAAEADDVPAAVDGDEAES